MSSYQRSSLLADLLDADRYVGCVRCVVHLHVDILFANGLEVTGTRETREACFERAVIHRLAFAQRDSAAQVAVAELVQSLEFNPLHNVREGISQVNRNDGGVLVSVEDGSCFDGAKGN